MATYKGVYCDCEGMTEAEAARVDNACREVKEFAAQVIEEMGRQGPGVTLALKHHFRLDVAAARGVGRQYQDNQISYITSVFRKIREDITLRMTYVRASGLDPRGWINPAFVAKVGPKVVHLSPGFFKNVPDSGSVWAWALLHEQAHFASRKSPAGINSITDHVYLDEDPKAYMAMSTQKALTNADSFKNFARELLDGGFNWDAETR